MEGKIIKYIEDNFNFGKVASKKSPKQGMSSAVFFLNFDSGFEVVVKYGDRVDKDFEILNILIKSNSQVPVPKIYGFFTVADTHVILLEKIQGKLFGEIEPNILQNFFKTVLETLNELHETKNENYTSSDWKNYLKNIFDGSTINWQEVLERKNIDKELVKSTLVKILAEIENLSFDVDTNSLLHTDFNQSNIFVDEEVFKIIGVVDWEEATFGDPVYDFARFHLHLWHREASKENINIFVYSLGLTQNQKVLEQLYLKFFILHYLAYYSESESEFNLQRINMHQDFLRCVKI